MKRTQFYQSTAGFSLVEVTLALAILAVGLLTILGLFPQGLESSRNAADQTIVATVVNDIFSQLRGSSFTNVFLSGNFQPGGGGPYDLTYSQTISNYFDKAGFETNALGGYLKLVLNCQSQSPLKLTRVTATVVWPAASKVPINTNIFVTNVAQYDQ